jgi:hypothetical protein
LVLGGKNSNEKNLSLASIRAYRGGTSRAVRLFHIFKIMQHANFQEETNEIWFVLEEGKKVGRRLSH